MIFGQKNTSTFPSSINLATSLNGQNGFFVAPCASIYDCSTTLAQPVGDINDDGIDDAMFGTDTTSVIIFGKKGNFTSPFYINSSNAYSGFIVSGFAGNNLGGGGIGDVNGDGIDDVIINANMTYVIYGQSPSSLSASQCPSPTASLSSTPTPSYSASPENHGSNNIGLIAGVVVGGVAFVAIAAAAFYKFCYHKHTDSSAHTGGTELVQSLIGVVDHHDD